MDHPISNEKLGTVFPDFMLALGKRLREGAECYGDASFGRKASEVLREMSQEALDIAGWGFIAWCRIKDLERRVAAFEKQAGNNSKKK